MNIKTNKIIPLKQKILLTLLSIFLLNSCGILSKSQPSELNKIVSLDNGVVPINSFTLVLADTVKAVKASNADNIILFVHGRGKHPQKAFEKHMLADLEDNYSAKVIMFHWPSWEGKYAFPVANARNSANDFIKVLEHIKIYKNHHQDQLKNIKFTLLTNSMGSYVLEQAMLMKTSQYKNMFDTLIINAAASSAKKHALWVNKIEMSQYIYITFNTEDKLLDKIGIKLLHKRLGKGIRSIFGHDFTLSNRAQYIDVSQFNLSHRYYLHRDFHKQAHLQMFYDAVLNGNPAILDSKHGVSKIKKKNIYVINPV